MNEHKQEYPNDTIRLLKERSSCRNFTDDPIPPEVLRTVLEAGIQAPTGGNLQPYSIIKIENPDVKRKLADLCERQEFVARAPVNLLFCIDLHRLQRWADLEVAPFTATYSFRHFWIAFQDTIICAQNICTAADSLGLGSVYVGSVLECFRELRELFRLPKGVFPVVLLSLGYPKSKPAPSARLGVEIVVHDEVYTELDDDRLLAEYASKYSRPPLPATDERLKALREVCTKVHGEEYAEKCVSRAKEQGFVSAVQRYFGLHYVASEMPLGNTEFLKILEESGFTWFKEFQPPVKR